MGRATYGKKGEKKKLSWIYRKKTKQQKSKSTPTETVSDVGQDNKKARIIVRNLSFKATTDDLKKLYQPFGDIQEINLLRHPDGKLVGCGFVQFKRIEDASKAIFNTNKKEFLGRVINSSWAISKSKFCEKLQQESVENVEHVDNEGNVILDKSKNISVEDPSKTQKNLLKRQSQRKLQKDKNRKKRARIVIRNLSFQATEENIREHFSQYGAIEDVEILKRSDGKSVGCAFLQFELVQSAAKAIHYANSKPLLNRPIVVDWAVPKSKFSKENSVDVKEETAEVKVENEDDTEGPCNGRKDLTRNTGDNGNDASLNEDSRSSGEEDDVPSDEETEADEKKMVLEETAEVKRPRRESHDVSEGKTVFLKNVPFSVKNEQLKKFMEQFGPVYYALICMDPLTEFSKGTAFVKFQNVEDAEKCLSAGTELQLEDQILEAQKALDRNEVENKASLKERRSKDSRNLYLVKEGVVLAGSSSAVGVSTTDMAKRLQIEQWKSQILRNLNMFVSRVRLVVHNLPVTLDDEKFRKIVERHCGPSAVIKEARVMRDFKNVDTKGVGRSKEYGFVSFTNHEDALRTLRSLNNNPNVFTPNRRPIVSFSIENRIMVNAKQRRVQKSLEQNPLWTGNNGKRKNASADGKVPAKKCKMGGTSGNESLKHSNDTETSGKISVPQPNGKIKKNKAASSKTRDVGKIEDSKEKPYAGTMGMPGQNKLRSNFNLKSQAILHNQAVKKEKKKNKSFKKLQIQNKEQQRSRSEIKPKQGVQINAADVNLDKLVSSYKTKLNSVDLKKSKWYES